MAEMLNPWQTFNHYREQARDAWDSRQCRNFGTAYERAQDKYVETLKAQEAADKAAAERKAQLIMLAMSLAGGSILVSVFGKSAFKGVLGEFAKNTALKVTVNRGWDKAFNALAWTESNASAKFVLGGLYDDVSGKITTAVSDALKAVPKGAKVDKGALGRQPGKLEFQNEIMNMMDRWEIAVRTTGKWIYEHWGGAEGLKRFQDTSPFFRPPRVALDKTKTAHRIELSFWMKLLLDRDYLKTGRWDVNRHRPRNIINPSTTISVDPWSKEYPKNEGGLTWQRVHYRQVGDLIQKRINEVHEEVIGGPLFISTIPGYDKVSDGTLRMASMALTQLSITNAREIKLALGT